MENFPDWKLIDPFVASHKPVRLECVRCGNVVKPEPTQLGKKFKGHCQKCQKLYKGRQLIAALLRDGHFPQFQAEDYQNKDVALPVICRAGKPFRVLINDYMGERAYRPKHDCSDCDQPPIPKPLPVQEELDRLEDYGYVIAGEYRTRNDKTFGYWVKCGHYDYVRPRCILIRRAGCQTCQAESQSEDVRRGLWAYADS
ncbi:hypothetical protein [Micromonospora sp. C72]|uniref:hypothetical protein n=1 Tax=Micromonospora sp. C72 TaxID=2824880 RepID=UPI001B38D893|nr:hypothetical protein [Micromonospora sp. C72]